LKDILGRGLILNDNVAIIVSDRANRPDTGPYLT